MTWLETSKDGGLEMNTVSSDVGAVFRWTCLGPSGVSAVPHGGGVLGVGMDGLHGMHLLLGAGLGRGVHPSLQSGKIRLF